MKDWAKAFYLSKTWRETRESYIASQHGLCERCGKPGSIVHHRKHLSRRTIDDPGMTLAWTNLELVCRECHAVEHEGAPATEAGLRFDANGNLVKAQTSPMRGKALLPE
jgi:5-methylcytosine-specific restriction endonuclease McrA